MGDHFEDLTPVDKNTGTSQFDKIIYGPLDCEHSYNSLVPLCHTNKER